MNIPSPLDMRADMGIKIFNGSLLVLYFGF